MSLSTTASTNNSRSASSGGRPWSSVSLYYSGDEFFAALKEEIAKAQSLIQMEMYIFAFDRLGQQVLSWLAAAVKRGVQVRLIIDGIGSSSWVHVVRARAHREGVHIKVFHELPWDQWLSSGRITRRTLSLPRLLQKMNSRDHRKLCLIDSRTAFVGSMNVVEYHCASLVGEAAWRDSGVKVEGEEVSILGASFDELWHRPRGPLSVLRRLRRRVRSGAFIKLNVRRAQRRDNYLDLLVRILGAERRIWITNAYFVPDGSLMRALRVAAESGVDVRIVVPAVSDIFFMPWVTSAFHVGLLGAGVRIFEYTGAMMHAKTILIDDWGLVGSSNLNHRSLFHDLEADVVLDSNEACQSLDSQYRRDCDRAREVTLDTWQERPWFERMIGRMLLWMRWVL